MNRKSIILNLEEALEQLSETPASIKGGETVTEDDFRVAVEHMYHHINFARNTRNTADHDLDNLTTENFYRWRVFPQDIDLAESPSE